MKRIDESAGQWTLAAVVVGLALRLAFGMVYWVDKPLTHDEREYLALAGSLQDGRGFRYEPSHDTGTTQQFGRAPGYPAFLALIGAGSASATSVPTRVKVAQSVVGALGIWIIAAIAARAAGPRAGAIAAALAAVYPPLVWVCSYALSESLYSVIALLAAHAVQAAAGGANQRTPGRRSWLLAASAGLLTGVAILTRPAMLLFLPLAALWMASRRQWGVALALVAAAVIVVAPWTIRNVREYGRFVLVASEGGVTFWTGNHPLARGEGDLAANPVLKMAELQFRRAHPGLTAEELEPLYYRDALNWIAAHPGQWLVLLLRKIFYTVVPAGPSYTLHSTKYWAASVSSYLVVLSLALVGYRRLWIDRRRPTAVLLLGASAVLVGLVFFPQERFRIPVIDPVLIIGAAAAVNRFAGDRLTPGEYA
jgi:hypothetical protein